MFDKIAFLQNGSITSGVMLGVSWLAIDLVLSALIFAGLERAFALHREQPFFRKEWSTDFAYFGVNHLLIAFLLMPANLIAQELLGSADSQGVRLWISSLPFPIALLLIVLVADLIQYWSHRAYHHFPLLWRFHAVHHSAKTLDWLSGSRQHIFELFMTRTLLLTPFIVLGFDTNVVNAFIVLGGLQAVFNHANINVRLGWVRYVVVTPNFHHWHHAQDSAAVDRNFAAHFSFLDYLFGTAANTEQVWPSSYGLRETSFPKGMAKQFAFPFTEKT